MGYVGLPLACRLSKFHNVVGFDINKRINNLRKGKDNNNDISKKILRKSRIKF